MPGTEGGGGSYPTGWVPPPGVIVTPGGVTPGGSEPTLVQPPLVGPGGIPPAWLIEGQGGQTPSVLPGFKGPADISEPIRRPKPFYDGALIGEDVRLPCSAR